MPRSGQPRSTPPQDPSRRRLLAMSGAAVGLALLPVAGRSNPPAPGWQNWSGSQRATPAAIHYPAGEAELVQAVKNAKAPLRAVGGSHSFTALVPTPGTVISLEQMSGLIDHDPQAQTATLGAGTRIAVAGELLAAIGQGLQNEPDINMQSLAGAISTATHGTGAALQCLSGYVTTLKLVLADGSVVTCSADKDRELFDAARVAFGSLGVISEITFRNRAAYTLREETKVMDLAAAMQHIEQRRRVDRHVEFLAFPYGGKAIVKRMNITDEADTPPVESSIDENELVELAADTVKAAPFTKGMIQKLVGAFVSDGHRVGPSHRIFPNVRSVPFNEMEYTVPADQGLACLQEVVDTMRARDIAAFFPIEFRYIGADDTWMSPFAQRDGAAISIHQYARQDYRELFDAIEPILKKYGGRPHWGKLHTLVAKDLRERYPRFDDFLAVRRRVDPRGKLLNDYLKTLLGA